MSDDMLFEITLGALLHDIGKVAQRASPHYKSKRHQEFGAEWLESLPTQVKNILEPAKEFILRHHTLNKNDPKYEKLDPMATSRNDLLIVWEADNLSSGERYKEDPDVEYEENVKFDIYIPLYSVLNRINIQGRKSLPKNFYLAFPPEYISPEKLILPTKIRSLSYENYKNLLEGFNHELIDIRGVDTSKQIQFLLNLLEKYFSFVPSETAYRDDPSTYPDVSLFDHLKSTAAIASSMYLYFKSQNINPGSLSRDEIQNRSEERYTLIGGDLSGIQDFVYSVTYRAALKGLRARSFYLELILHHVAKNILDGIGLYRTNLLYIGGGNFFILAPNTTKVKQTVGKIRTKFNQWLLQEFDGKLFLSLDYTAFSGQSFLLNGDPSITQIWSLLYEKLNAQKSRKFSELVDKSFFSPPNKRGSVCSVCGKYTTNIKTKFNEEEGVEYLYCKSCYSLEEFGSKILKSKFIEVTHSPNSNCVEIEDIFYCPTSKVPLDAKNFFSINDYYLESIPIFMGNYPETGVEFEELTKKSVGANYLGTMRADVDNLGLIFSTGLDKSFRSLSRISTMSRLFSLFFKNYVNILAKNRIPDSLKLSLSGYNKENPQGKNIVIVYSGGDDLFVTGAWNDVITFTIELSRLFSRFTSYNPSLSISAGITLTPPKYPIYRIAQLAGEAEEKSKDIEGKASLTMLGSTYKWTEWENTIENILIPLLNIGKFSNEAHVRFIPSFSRSLIYKLLQLQEIFEKSIDKNKKDDAYLVLPLISYVLGRATPKGYNEHWLKFLSKAVSINLDETIDWLRKIKSPLIWVDYLSRGGE